jgi:hypothetical protein
LRPGVLLPSAAAAVLLAGCSLKEEQPTEIPPPATPTDVREAHRIARAVGTYLEDQQLIRQTRRSCSRGLPPALFEQVCLPELRPLVAQRRTHLREGLDDLQRRVGPRCSAALRSARSVALADAAGPLRAARLSCLREYRRAAAR